MRTTWLFFCMLVAVLLIVGIAVSYLRPAPPPDAQEPLRQMLWEGRLPDLAIQLGLLLVGAFGIRALLPSSADEEESDEQLD